VEEVASAGYEKLSESNGRVRSKITIIKQAVLTLALAMF